MDAPQVGVAAEDVGVAAPVALAGGEHGAAGVADRLVEGQVLARGGGLGELDVVDDLARPGRVQAANRPRVQGARERPRLTQDVEALGVDGDDHDVVGRFGSADVVARLQGLALEPVEGPRPLDRDADRERQQRYAGEGTDTA